jgi:Ca-activated chloride channel family protein
VNPIFLTNLAKALLCSFTLICLTSLMVQSLQAQELQSNRVMFVLDGSNSMWGQIDGTAKISIAKDVMVDLVNDWDANIPVGLMIYGHRRKDDCSDIELVSSPGNLDRELLVDKIKSITPRGKTPITSSLIQAALAVHSSKGNPSVVLVSDGLETCDADPCAAAFSFDLVNPGFDVHVIGFDVNEEESKALQCIADRSGGKFFRANDADQLKNALSETVAVASGQQLEGGQQAPLDPAPLDDKPTMLLNAAFCSDCENLPSSDLNWTIRNGAGETVHDGVGAFYAGTEPLDPGTYDVSVRYKSSALVKEAQIEIGIDGKQVGKVNLNGGSAILFAYASDDDSIAAEPILYRFFEIRDGNASRKPVSTTIFSDQDVWLPAGQYRVTAVHEQIEESAQIEITAGQQTRYAFDLRVGYVLPEAVLTTGAEPLGRFMDYRIYASEKAAIESSSSGIKFIRGGSAAKPLKPGTYYVRAILSYNRGVVGTENVFPLEIVTNETAKPVFDMNAGVIKHTVTSESGQRIWSVGYFDAVTEKRVEFQNSSGNYTGALGVGSYYLLISTRDEEFKSEPFDIVAGETTNLEMTIP